MYNARVPFHTQPGTTALTMLMAVAQWDCGWFEGKLTQLETPANKQCKRLSFTKWVNEEEAKDEEGEGKEEQIAPKKK